MSNPNEEHSDIRSLLQETLHENVPPQVERRLRPALTGLRARMEQRRERLPFPALRRRPIPLAASILAVAIASLCLVHWLGGRSVALADVLERVRTAQTVTYDFSTAVGDGPPNTSHVMILEPAKVRMTMPQGLIMVADKTAGETLMLLPAQKKAMRYRMTPAQGTQSPQGFLDELRSLQEATGERLGRREIAGQTAIGYRVASKGIVWTIWADSRSGLPVRVEVDSKVLGRGVMENFQFDVKLDESLFSLTPPQGYLVEVAQADAAKASDEDLISGLRFVAQLGGDHFPAEFSFESIASMWKEHWESRPAEWGEKPPAELAASFGRAIAFVSQMKPENDWHYAGKGAMLGEPDRPICWWRPDGSETYRVIYADLKVRDVRPDELPREPARQAQTSP